MLLCAPARSTQVCNEPSNKATAANSSDTLAQRAAQRAAALGAGALPARQRCAPARCVPVRCELCNQTPSKGSLHSNALRCAQKHHPPDNGGASTRCTLAELQAPLKERLASEKAAYDAAVAVRAERKQQQQQQQGGQATEQPDKLAQLDMRMLLVHGNEVGGGRLSAARARRLP